MSSLGTFVCSTTDQLRGVYKPYQCAGVILPFSILRRLGCILEPIREHVEAVMALLSNTFPNTGIAAHNWILKNTRAPAG